MEVLCLSSSFSLIALVNSTYNNCRILYNNFRIIVLHLMVTFAIKSHVDEVEKFLRKAWKDVLSVEPKFNFFFFFENYRSVWWKIILIVLPSLLLIRVWHKFILSNLFLRNLNSYKCKKVQEQKIKVVSAIKGKISSK